MTKITREQEVKRLIADVKKIKEHKVDIVKIDISKATGYDKTKKQKLVKDPTKDVLHFEDDVPATSVGTSIQKKEYTTLTPIDHKDEIMGIIAGGEDIQMYLKKTIIGGDSDITHTAPTVGLTSGNVLLTIPNSGKIPIGSTITISITYSPLFGANKTITATFKMDTLSNIYSTSPGFEQINLKPSGAGGFITSIQVWPTAGRVKTYTITAGPDYTYTTHKHVISRVDEIKINTYGHDNDTHYFFYGLDTPTGTIKNFKDQPLTTEDKGYALVVEWVPKTQVTIAKGVPGGRQP